MAIGPFKNSNLDALAETLLSKGAKDVTEASLIEAKRQAIMRALSEREGAEIVKENGALYSSSDELIRAVCTISKRYTNGPPYWYGYSPQWDQFLSGSQISFFVLGCMDRGSAFAVPHERIKKLLPYLNRTPDRHWHIFLEENDAGQVELALPKTGSKIGLGEFEVRE